ncbi:hypothetical protein Fmac_026774 [Flemingia macrophylla]|uniref:Uncharacterized protein n=1 Tax=Flemingia macrophylla TaxID=520843 RepID=A0ABD1LFT2_9FABA
MWPGAASRSSFNYNHDIYVVAAPASSFHHHNDPVLSDPSPNPNPNPAATALGVNVFPLLTGEGMVGNVNSHHHRNKIQLWQGHEGIMVNNNSGNGNSNSNSHRNRIQLWQDEESPPPQHVEQEAAGGSATCQDCGNQAKKDCSHRRCRTCCKSRGFDCATHVKSTWVPASRRRERQLMAVTGAAAVGSSGATSGAKKARIVASQTTTTSHTSTSNNTTTPPRSFDTGSSHQDMGLKESLPCQVRAPAVFKCVRVTAVDDGEDEYAYQAVVKIAGHVFKGFLYDQGTEAEDKDGYPNLSELHLGGNVASASGGGRNGISSSSPMVDPSHVYAASGAGGLLGGSSNYGNPIN